MAIGEFNMADHGFEGMHPDMPIEQQVHRILEGVVALTMGNDTSGARILSSIVTAPSLATLQRLEFGNVQCAADDIVQLLVALPCLVSLTCGIRDLKSDIESIPARERPSRLCAKYCTLSSNFRVLRVSIQSVQCVEYLAYAAMLLAILCSNFVQVDLPLEFRKSFGRQIAWAIINATFRPYYDSISRIVYMESD
ncbi:hypothetical protein GGI21_001695 [Coemansia aciculifera]|nr:hypothetical protein GGI21_001695 [Coemansia aciculifera]